MGCLNCKYKYTKHGTTQCEWEPHKYAIQIQRDIVLWLSELGRDAMRDEGCPGFKKYYPKT